MLLRTDATWESGPLPILQSGIYFGEIYDARLEGRPATAGVEVLAFDTGLLVPQECRPVRELAPFPVRGELDRPQGAARSTTSARTRPATSPSRCAARRARG